MAQPTVLVLSGEVISDQANPARPLYHISKSVDELTHKISSIRFSRFIAGNDNVIPEGVDRTELGPDNIPTPPSISDQKHQHTTLYNLVHPCNAKYRTDIPADYYMTSCSPAAPESALGNIKFLANSSKMAKYLPLHKATHTALLYPSSSWLSVPLFPQASTAESAGSNMEREGDGMQGLFTVKTRRSGAEWEWAGRSTESKIVAREERMIPVDGEVLLARKLAILPGNDMTQETLDALVGLWVLRLWWTIAEEKEFQKEALVEMTPPSAVSYGGMTKMMKRTGALGGFAAAGGAC